MTMDSANSSPRSRSFDSSSQSIFETSGYTTPDQNELRNTPLAPIENICFVGAGYVGGPTAAIIALQNPHILVTVVDKDADRIQKWKSRHLPVHEPNLDLVVRIARDGLRNTARGSPESINSSQDRKPNLIFSTDVDECISAADVVFIAVNTPTKTRGIGSGAATNLAAFESAVVSIAKSAKSGAIIVEKSTVPCGTAQKIREILDLYRPEEPFEILSNPEFLAEGTAVRDLLRPDRILIGSTKTLSGLNAAQRLRAVYSSWVDPAKVLTVNVWSSELAKVVANAMLAQRISSINTISAICDKTGAEIDEVALAIGQDTRLGSKFLKAGLGFGGSCFKKDILALTYLANSLHLPEVADYWMSVLTVNDFQQNRFIYKVVDKLNGALVGKKITVLGFAFKQDTNDTRESPALEVIKALVSEGPREIAVFDPGCTPLDINWSVSPLKKELRAPIIQPEGPVKAYNDAYSACYDASAVLILTAWKQFQYPVPQNTAMTPPAVKSKSEIPSPTIVTEIELPPLDSPATITPGSPVNILEDSQIHARLCDLPICPSSCTLCHDTEKHPSLTNYDPLDWEMVALSMREPKWVFDGRNIVSGTAMAKLGFRVENLGNSGPRWNTWGGRAF